MLNRSFSLCGQTCFTLLLGQQRINLRPWDTWLNFWFRANVLKLGGLACRLDRKASEIPKTYLHGNYQVIEYNYEAGPDPRLSPRPRAWYETHSGLFELIRVDLKLKHWQYHVNLGHRGWRFLGMAQKRIGNRPCIFLTNYFALGRLLLLPIDRDQIFDSA